MNDAISGYELAEHLFSKGGVAALLRYAGNAETDWLELKAAMCLSKDDRKKGVSTEKDLYSKYAQELVALANTSGGAFIIGVQDQTLNLVPLEDNDPGCKIAKGGFDAYMLEFVRPNLWPEGLKWTDHGKVWELINKAIPLNTLTWLHAPYVDSHNRSGEVLVVLVRPFAEVQKTKHEGKYTSLLRRTDGDVGQVKPNFEFDQILSYSTDREIRSLRYASIARQFDEELEKHSQDAELDEAIGAYYRKLKDKARHMMAVFTPLDAQENAFADNDSDAFYSPEAVELFEDENDWLREDSHELIDDEDLDSEDDEGECDDICGDCRDESSEREARRGDLLGILGSEPRVIVSGEPGGGKTTCLLCYSLQRESTNLANGRELALFIPMGQWSRGGSLESMMKKASGLRTEQLSQLVLQKRLRLVIDAVNECPDSLRAAAILNIDKYLRLHPDIPAIVSTRHPDELVDLRLPVFHVQPMDDEHRRHYLERYLGDGDQAARLLSQIMEMPGGETIAENPMLLRLVVDVYQASPCRHLPNGRAGLYRRSLHYWYRRESEKSRRAGRRLAWTEEETIGLLSEISYRSRLNGYRDIPLDFVREIWENDSDLRLKELCQGPVVYLDAEFLRFRHETFQEYLCAEFLLAHSDETPEWTTADYARWGMPIAYAIELLESVGRPLPERIWLSAWSLNPWLGVAVTKTSVGEQILRGRYDATLPMIDGLRLGSRNGTNHVGMVYISAAAACFTPRILASAVIGMRGQRWYRKTDTALSYLVSVQGECREKWNVVEKSQLSHLKHLQVEEAIALARNWLCLKNPREIFQFHASDQWDKWVSMPPPKRARALMDAKIAIPEDFESAKQVWIENVSLKKAILMGRRGMLKASDVVDRVQIWIKSASVEQAVEMVNLGWCSKAAFAERMSCLKLNAGVQTLVDMVSAGFMLPIDVRARAVELMDEIGPTGIEALIGAGILERSECRERLSAIMAMGRAEDAVALVRLGVAQVGEFSSLKTWWVERATPESLSVLVNADLASRADVEKRISQLIVTASPAIACKLIQNRLADVSKFYERVSAWAGERQYDVISDFVEKYGDAEVRSRLMPSVRRWIANASVQSAIALVRAGFATSGDFQERLPWWKETADAETWRNFLSCKLVTPDEYRIHDDLCREIEIICKSVFKKRLSALAYEAEGIEWAKTVPLSCVGQLIRAGVVEAGQFHRRVNEWLSTAKGDEASCIIRLRRNGVITLAEAMDMALPLVSRCSISDAICLCEEKILLCGDLFERKKEWIANIDVDDAVRLLNLAVLFPEDVAERVPEWVGSASPRVASWLVRSGLVPADEFRGRIDEWKKEWSLLDAARLINDGIVNLENVAGDVALEEYWRKRTVRGVVRMITVDGAEIDVSGTTAVLPMAELKSLQGECSLRRGEEYDFDLIDGGVAADFVLSRVGVLKRQSLQQITVGAVYDGVVSRIVSEGAYVTIGSIAGFLHVDDIRGGDRNGHKKLHYGQHLKVKVLAIDHHRCSITLGFVQPKPGPINSVGANPKKILRADFSLRHKLRSKGSDQLSLWSGIAKRFPVEARIRGKISNLVRYGAFVEIADGVSGLLHISNMGCSQDERVRYMGQLCVGQAIEVVVKSVDERKHRIVLGI